MILQNITKVWQRINDAEQQFDRTSGAVDLLLVSKGHSIAEIKEAVQAGVHRFGENYVQEAVPKIAALLEDKIEWHYIGRIQGNKTRVIAENFAWVHSVESVRIAGRLSMHRPANLPPLNVCLQLNVSQENNKSGAMSGELMDLAEAVEHLPHLNLRGLMVIPEKTRDFRSQRSVFRQAFQHYRSLLAEGYALDTLSMGMSDDFEAAIAEGSTMVRIGTAVFGPRATVRS